VAVVEQYWDGVLKRLQAEVDVFSRLVQHQGERGRENELAFARLLEGLVPRRYGLGSGLLIDAADNCSKQMDIVVFDQSGEPTVMAQTTQLLFPVEQVRAAVEVKTTLTAREVRDCGLKRASVGRLTSHAPGGKQPLFIVLAYNADSSGATVAANFAALPETERPDLVCLLEPGLLLAKADRLGGEHEGFAAGLVFLHEREPDGARRAGRYMEPGAGEHASARVGDSVYPVEKDSGGVTRVAEPARALLLFCEALLALLSEWEADPKPWLGHYLGHGTRELDWIDLPAPGAADGPAD